MKLQEMYDATPCHCKPRCFCCVHKAWRSICLCIHTYVNINNIYLTTYIYKLSSYDTHACCTDFTTYISGFLGKSSFLYSSLILLLRQAFKIPSFSVLNNITRKEEVGITNRYAQRPQFMTSGQSIVWTLHKFFRHKIIFEKVFKNSQLIFKPF